MSKPRAGLTRLWRYTEGRRRRLLLVLVLAAISAAAPVVGWHIVGDAIDNGIHAGRREPARARRRPLRRGRRRRLDRSARRRG